MPIRHRTVISENTNEDRIIEFPISSDNPTRINPPRPPFNMDIFGTQFQDGAKTITGDPSPLTTIEEEALFSDINVRRKSRGLLQPRPFFTGTGIFSSIPKLAMYRHWWSRLD